MKMVSMVIIVSALFFAFCNSPEKNASGITMDKAETSNNARAPVPASEMQGQTYRNEKFGFQLRYPNTWQAQEQAGRQGLGFVLNIVPAGRQMAANRPLTVHADAAYSYVAVIPGGLGTELPSGDVKTVVQAGVSLPVNFDVSTEKSRIFYLQNGEPWAYFIVPATRPPAWQNGFVFAQMAVDSFCADCFDKTTGQVKSPKHCDPLTGDKVVRSGTVNKKDATAIRQILSSLNLNGLTQTSASEAAIRIREPAPNSKVSSPLRVNGEARGTWFFEGSFSVVLYGADGKSLANGIAKAEGKWMTEAFVAFSTTLRFAAPDDKEGKLVFQKANPSALKTKADSLVIPVSFL